jgi:hypothetical protein
VTKFGRLRRSVSPRIIVGELRERGLQIRTEIVSTDQVVLRYGRSWPEVADRLD